MRISLTSNSPIYDNADVDDSFHLKRETFNEVTDDQTYSTIEKSGLQKKKENTSSKVKMSG